jgi:hypothetical protein
MSYAIVEKYFMPSTYWNQEFLKILHVFQLITYGLFNNSVYNSHYTALNDRMIIAFGVAAVHIRFIVGAVYGLLPHQNNFCCNHHGPLSFMLNYCY